MQLLVNLLKIVISQINIKGAIVCKLGQLNIRKEESQLWELLVLQKACPIGRFTEIYLGIGYHSQLASNVWHSIPKPFYFVFTKICPWRLGMLRLKDQPWIEIKQCREPCNSKLSLAVPSTRSLFICVCKGTLKLYLYAADFIISFFSDLLSHHVFLITVFGVTLLGRKFGPLLN